MSDDNLSWADRYRIQGEVWADAEAAAQLLEDCKSSVMAERQVQFGADLPVNRAEQLVKSSPEWREYLTNCVDARKKANLAKINLEAVRIGFLCWQANDANERTERRLTT